MLKRSAEMILVAVKNRSRLNLLLSRKYVRSVLKDELSYCIKEILYVRPVCSKIWSIKFVFYSKIHSRSKNKAIY